MEKRRVRTKETKVFVCSQCGKEYERLVGTKAINYCGTKCYYRANSTLDIDYIKEKRAKVREEKKKIQGEERAKQSAERKKMKAELKARVAEEKARIKALTPPKKRGRKPKIQ
ncbi:MAG: hypothetical protein RLZZ292_2215 [Bacteroidota bacterium]|jgi:predicted ATP-dependent serine protease